MPEEVGDEDGVVDGRRRIVDTALGWGIWTGAGLLSLGTLGLVIGFSLTDFKSHQRVYCKEMDWYHDYLVDGDHCRLDVAVDRSCPYDPRDRAWLATVSETIEYWPYATSLVMGVGATNIFIALLFVDFQLGQARLALLAYLSFVSLWFVVGTSAYGGSIVLAYLHYASAFLLVVASALYCTLALWETYSNVGAVVTVVVTVILWLAGVGMGVTAVLFWVSDPRKDHGISDPRKDHGISDPRKDHGMHVGASGAFAVCELVFIYSFSIACLLMVRRVSGAGAQPGTAARYQVLGAGGESTPGAGGESTPLMHRVRFFTTMDPGASKFH